MCVLILSTIFVWNISHSKKKWTRYDKNVYSCPILMKLEFSKQIFEKSSNIKFNENLSSGSRVVPYGQTNGRTDGRTGIMKLIGAFRNFANAPKNVIMRAWTNARSVVIMHIFCNFVLLSSFFVLVGFIEQYFVQSDKYFLNWISHEKATRRGFGWYLKKNAQNKCVIWRTRLSFPHSYFSHP